MIFNKSIRISEFDAKINAINDVLAVLKQNESISVSYLLKYVRKLSSKQYKIIYKKEKLQYARQ